MWICFTRPASIVLASRNKFEKRSHIKSNLASGATYPAARPAAGCRCRPSTEWPCRTQTWAAAPTADQSAASRPFPQGSGTRRIRREEHAASRRTAPGWAPVWIKRHVDLTSCSLSSCRTLQPFYRLTFEVNAMNCTKTINWSHTGWILAWPAIISAEEIEQRDVSLLHKVFELFHSHSLWSKMQESLFSVLYTNQVMSKRDVAFTLFVYIL